MLKLKNLFIQHLIKKGKKNKAEKILIDISKKFLLEHNVSCYKIFIHSIKRIRFTIGFKNIRLKGSSYKIPLFQRKRQQVKIALNWLRTSSLEIKYPFLDSLIREFLRSDLEQGNIFVRRKKIFKLANLNKVFAHYR